MAFTANLVDAGSPAWRMVLRRFGRQLEYQVNGGAAATVWAYVRGVREDDLFAAAIQQDVAAVVDAAEFKTLFGSVAVPRRFDRLRLPDRSFTVEEWRGAPNDATPVFYKLLLRGGSQ